MRERPFRRLSSTLAVCAGFLATWTCGMTLADLQIERIFGPETPSGSYKHASSITELDNGDLLLAFYSRMGNLQAAVVELDPGHLLALCRRGGDYEPGNDGYVVRTESHDAGRTWSPGLETEFPNPNASVELIKLRSGTLLFIYNHSMHERSPLRAVASTDGGRTWPRQLDLASGDGSFSYPTAIQTSDGRIHVTFTSDGRTVLRHAIFSEADLR